MIQDQMALEKLQKFLQLNKLPSEDLTESYNVKGRIYLGYEDDRGELIGSGGLELYGTSALLRSVAVKEQHRDKFIGRKIVDDLIQKAKEMNISDIYLLTESAQDYFVKLGFTAVDRNEVPEKVRASSEFTHICPTSAVCMFYKL
jgi:amino-acid N-acetyltransferase